MRRTVNFLSAKKRLYPLSCKGYRRIDPSRAGARVYAHARAYPPPCARRRVEKNCAAVGGFAALQMRRAPCGYSTAFRPEENSRASAAYSVFPVLPGGRRPRKVRLAPFPPVEKTPPASLHPKGTSAPTPWAWALLLSPPCGARRDPLSVLPKEKRAVHGPKRKAPGCALVQWPSALKGGRRIGACSDLALPSGTLCSSAISPTAVPWRMVRKLPGCKDAFELLRFSCLALRRSGDFRHQCFTGSSFRAFGFATHCPGGHRSCSLALC